MGASAGSQRRLLLGRSLKDTSKHPMGPTMGPKITQPHPNQPHSPQPQPQPQPHPQPHPNTAPARIEPARIEPARIEPARIEPTPELSRPELGQPRIWPGGVTGFARFRPGESTLAKSISTPPPPPPPPPLNCRIRVTTTGALNSDYKCFQVSKSQVCKFREVKFSSFQVSNVFHFPVSIVLITCHLAH
jgi:hypothetical protein